MMGAGKSAVGAALARRLGRPFVDTDAEVEARGRAARSPEIFAARARPASARSSATAIEALAARGAVVALGGGADRAAGRAASASRGAARVV